MKARSGSVVAIDGELTAPAHASRPIRVAILGPGDKPVASASTRADLAGYFHAESGLPNAMPSGSCGIVARYRTVEGRARLTIG